MATEYTLSISDLLKDVLPDLPGAVRSVAEREMRLTLREFFERTFAWTATVKDVTIPAGETAIQVDDSDANTEVIGILDVMSGESGSGYTSLRALPGRPGDETTGTDPYAWYVTSNPDEVVLFPYVTGTPTKDLTVMVALKPADSISATTDVLPRQITLKYYDAIIDGFLARMYGHPNKPYSAPQVAVMKRQSFIAGCGRYAGQRRQGYNGTQNWAYPRSWGVSKVRS